MTDLPVPRRYFFRDCGYGVGKAALASLLAGSARAQNPGANSPGSPAFNNVTSASTQSDGDQFHGRIDHQFSPSDLLFGRYSGTEIKLNNEDYLILKASDVLAVVE